MNERRIELAKIHRQKNDLDTKTYCLISSEIEEAEELDDDLFWELVDVVRNRIARQGGHSVLKGGIENGLRDIQEEHGMDVMLQFIRTYDRKCALISNHLWDDAQMGDDSWNDFCDAAPMQGRGVFEGFMNRERKVKDLGENYIGMTLTKMGARVVAIFTDVSDVGDGFDEVGELKKELDQKNWEIKKLREKLDTIRELAKSRS